MKNTEIMRKTLEASGLSVIDNEPLYKHSTFRIGGPAAFCVKPSEPSQLQNAVKAARDCGVRYCVVGNGSNILFADAGFDGLVILTTGTDRISITGNKLTVGSGASFTKLSSAARDAGLSGMEFAYGIPGTVGGAVYMNAGAYGGETSQVLTGSVAYDAARNETVDLDNAAHSFGYRTSVYARNALLTVLSTAFELVPKDRAEITAAMNDFMTRRREKQPLEYPSAGSTFKRPTGNFAGKLIEDSGLKGFSIGGAQVSEKHAGFVINRGEATAEDVLRLISYIRETVFRNYNIELECEIKYID